MAMAGISSMKNVNHMPFLDNNQCLDDIFDGDPLESELADIADLMSKENDLLDTSPQDTQLHGGHEEHFSLGNNRNDNSPPHQNGYTSDEPYQAYPQSSQLIQNYVGDFQQKHALPQQDHSFPQYQPNRCLPDSPPDSGSEPCFSPPDLNETDLQCINHWKQLPHHQILNRQINQLHTLPGGNSPSAESSCSQHSGGSSTGSSYMHNASYNEQQQLSPYEHQVQLQEFENTLDSVRINVANSSGLQHQPTMEHIIGNAPGFHGNGSYTEQRGRADASFYPGTGQSHPGAAAESNIHSPVLHGLPRSVQQHANPLMDQFLNSGQISHPPAKKRKVSDGFQPLDASHLKQHYQDMLAMQQLIKQEPGLTPPTGQDYYNDTYEMGDPIPRHQVNMQAGITGAPTLSIHNTVQMPACRMGSSMLPQSEETQRLTSAVSTPGLSACYMTNTTNKAINWSPHQGEKWCQLLDADYKNLSVAPYRVDADKGFTFAVPDDTFVCQKKNHFQVTVHIGLEGHPTFVKTEEGPKKIDAFYLNLYGAKYESVNQTIIIEQSQSDRSKKSLHPVKVDLPANQVTKVTVGRLHFSETTANNMRKKGRPNPDQRYFMCVVALQAQAQGKRYMVCASQTEKIIVRASNPGQFDSDQVPWQCGSAPDSIYHVGKVGIECHNPDEALVVHGNVKVTGRLMQPSDMRAKENIEEVNVKEQLKNVQNIRIVRYNYSPEYCEMTGIDPKTVTTGVIAQEFKEVLPNAVKETGDVQLSDGRTIPNFLVVDKDQLYMENVGAVKELCNLTSNFETRIEQLEKWNKKLAKLKKYDSVRSNFSGISGFSTSTGTPSVSRMGSVRSPRCSNNDPGSKGKIIRESFPDSDYQRRNRDNRSATTQDDGLGCFNQKLTRGLVIGLFLIMLFSFVGMSTMYGISLSNNGDSGCTGPSCILRKENNASSSDPTTKQPGSTELQSPATRPHVVEAISYCPKHGKSKCEKTKIYCCAVLSHGRQISMPCARDLEVLEIFPTVFAETSSLKAKEKTHHSGWKKKVPRERYGPSHRSNKDAKPYPFPHHHAKEGKQLRLHHAEGPQTTIMGHPRSKHPAFSKTHVTKVLASTSTAGMLTTNYTKVQRENLEPRSDFDAVKVKPPGIIQDTDHEDSIDDVKQDEIDAKASHQTSKDASLPASLVVKRVRRSADNNDKSGLRMDTIRLVEPDVLLYDDENGTQYLTCNNRGNVSFNVPVSMHTPPGVQITLEFNTTAPGYVYLCQYGNQYNCPELPGEIQPEVAQEEHYSGGKMHRFQLFFSSFVSSDYWFRLTMNERSSNCKSPANELGKTFHIFRFRFYRPCPDEKSPDEESDNSPTTQAARALGGSGTTPMPDKESAQSVAHPDSDMAIDLALLDTNYTTPSHNSTASNDTGIET